MGAMLHVQVALCVCVYLLLLDHVAADEVLQRVCHSAAALLD